MADLSDRGIQGPLRMFEFLPDESFDVIHAHSVFTHTRADVIAQCFRSVARILKQDGFFDLTYLEGDTFSFADEDFSYPTGMLLDMAAGHGLEGSVMTDWEYADHKKLRLRRTRNLGHRVDVQTA